MTGRADYLDLGNWNVACFECGRKRKASTMQKHWQGYYVCPEHWEPRQTQDFVRAIPEKPAPPWVQPMSDVFVGNFCSTRDGRADYAEADCAIVGYIEPA